MKKAVAVAISCELIGTLIGRSLGELLQPPAKLLKNSEPTDRAWTALRRRMRRIPNSSENMELPSLPWH